MYGGGPLSFMLLELGARAVGISRGALDAYEELMTSRLTIYPPIVPRSEDPDYQLRYGEATGKISAAEAAVSTIPSCQICTTSGARARISSESRSTPSATRCGR